MDHIKKIQMPDWVISKLQIPWIGTCVLIMLGSLSTIFPLTLFYGVQIMVGSAAVLIALRLHGAIYGLITFTVIHLLNNIVAGFEPRNLTVMMAHFIELLWMLGWQIRWKNGSLIKANAVFWVVMLLPVIYCGHYVLGLDIEDLKYEYMYIAVIGMVNALIAGIVVDFWITMGEQKSKRTGTIPLTRIAFKYVVAFVVFVSLVLLSADSRRQLSQMNDAILREMKYASNAVVQDLDEEYVTAENMEQNMTRYHHLLGVNVILLNRNDTVVASGLNALHPGEYLDMDRFSLLKSRDNLILFSSANIHYSDVLNHWKQASFIYEAEMTNITPYRVFIVTDSSKYYPRIESIYLTTLQSLFIIIVASMIVAAPLSSKVVSPLLRLTRMTGSLPRILFRNGKLEWPTSHVTEVQILIGNLRKMADVLLEQFEQIRHDKLTLEDRVIERTKELKNSEEVKRAIIESSIDAIIAVDSTGQIIEFNPEAERMFGLRREEVILHKEAPSLFQGASCMEIKKLLERFEYVEGKRYTIVDEISGIRRDGSVFPIEYKIVEIQLGKNETLYNLFIKDITERTRAEEDRVRHALALEKLNSELFNEKIAIQEQRDISEQFIESVREGLVMSDRSGTITIVNRRIEEMFGLGDFLGRSIEDLAQAIDTMVLTDNFNLMEQTRAFLNGETAFIETEFIFNNVDKSVFSLYMKQMDVPGKNHGFLLVFRDRTGEERLDRMKNELISVVSHELRTPVATIMGYVELMMMYDLPAAQQQEFMQTIASEGKRLSSLLDDVLDIQRLDNEGMAYHMTYVPLVELVEGVAEQWNMKSTQRIYVHTFNGDFFAYADQNRMVQVLHNLVGNAVKYSPGADRIDVTLWEEEEWLCLDVRDYGIGIAEQEKDMLFNKFYRVDNSDHRQIGGTGIGLYISRKIVEDHKGTLTFISAPDKGSTFKVRLPKQDVLV
ncbi:PAS domain-containing sensor histidine kinase [Paenibacillus sp. 1781tsa1]|uniref:PAS domain-containing sensor histidine kinase n=1 Tax=Paenibacillus sp. 1781tsa1 TaxID=2953810 RepID=UPI0020A0AF35|nr:PAS domain-containing sensor histidine kinase [Paenibacillus sp. 1781tsa1]MCP1186664.1 ATP-binding protein [Paenibacillus sp. 1781tsa1]